MKRRIEESALLRATKRARAGIVGDEVDVAVPVLLLRVGHAVELVGQEAAGSWSAAQRGDRTRELAGPGLNSRPSTPTDVAQVEALELFVGRVAERIAADEELDPAGRVLQGREARLAPSAAWSMIPAGDADRGVLCFERLVVEMTVLSPQLGGAVAAGLKSFGERDPAGADRGELGAAFGNELVVILFVHPNILAYGDRRLDAASIVRNARSGAKFGSRVPSDPISRRHPRLDCAGAPAMALWRAVRMPGSDCLSWNAKIAVVGLGYVGLPVAVAFGLPGAR